MMTVTITDGTTTVVPLDMIGYSAARTTRNVFHEVLGRNDDDVTLRKAGLRSGTLTFLFDNASDADDCVTLHAGASSLSLTDTDLTVAAMTYAVKSNITANLDDETLTVWTVAVDFQEISP